MRPAAACLWTSTFLARSLLGQGLRAYHRAMSKQHKAFCTSCGKVTNHVTHYEKSDGGQLVATVHCAEHAEETP